MSGATWMRRVSAAGIYAWHYFGAGSTMAVCARIKARDATEKTAAPRVDHRCRECSKWLEARNG